MKMNISINGVIVTALLYDNPTSKDFAASLPLTLNLEDYNGTEKISEITHKLTIQGAPSGFEPSMGDITYYEPWGNLALFRKDFSYSNGLVLLGKITGGIEAINVNGTIVATFELDPA